MAFGSLIIGLGDHAPVAAGHSGNLSVIEREDRIAGWGHALDGANSPGARHNVIGVPFLTGPLPVVRGAGQARPGNGARGRMCA